MRVTVETYDPRWPRDVERIRHDLEAALREVDLLRIEHVGSTSVPGLTRSGITMRDNSGYLVGTLAGMNAVLAKILKRAGTFVPSGQNSRGDRLVP